MSECKYTDCFQWKPGISEDDCDDCVDGRFTEAVNVYASTCDGCAELTSHEEMTMDEKTQLGYCHACARLMLMEKVNPRPMFVFIGPGRNSLCDVIQLMDKHFGHGVIVADGSKLTTNAPQEVQLLLHAPLELTSIRDVILDPPKPTWQGKKRDKKSLPGKCQKIKRKSR